jgi:hypothetical protein
LFLDLEGFDDAGVAETVTVGREQVGGGIVCRE